MENGILAMLFYKRLDIVLIKGLRRIAVLPN